MNEAGSPPPMSRLLANHGVAAMRTAPRVTSKDDLPDRSLHHGEVTLSPARSPRSVLPHWLPTHHDSLSDTHCNHLSFHLCHPSLVPLNTRDESPQYPRPSLQDAIDQPGCWCWMLIHADRADDSIIVAQLFRGLGPLVCFLRPTVCPKSRLIAMCAQN